MYRKLKVAPLGAPFNEIFGTDFYTRSDGQLEASNGGAFKEFAPFYDELEDDFKRGLLNFVLSMNNKYGRMRHKYVIPGMSDGGFSHERIRLNATLEPE